MAENGGFDLSAILQNEETVQQLRQTGCPILGTVLNRVEFDSYMSKKYYYKSHYYGNYEGEEKPGAAQSSAGKGARTRKK